MQASGRQRFVDTAHPSPSVRQGVGTTSLKQLTITAELKKKERKRRIGEKYFLVSYSGDPPNLL
jgi:hypothetical protein